MRGTWGIVTEAGVVSIQGQVALGPGQPDLVEGVPAHGRGIGIWQGL